MNFTEILYIKDRVFGIDADGEWCTRLTDTIFAYPNESKNGMYYMICLEKNVSEIKDKLKSCREVNKFPFFYIIRSGLDSSSEYWVDKSIEWIKELEFQLDEKEAFKTKLEDIMEDKRFQQNIRHKAKKVFHCL